MQKSLWLGQEFYALLQSVTWYELAGVYIFCGVTPANLWLPLYVGQADSFHNRIPQHERWTEAVALGATHVHARVGPLQADRDQLEQALIREYHPQLNTHHRVPPFSGFQ